MQARSQSTDRRCRWNTTRPPLWRLGLPQSDIWSREFRGFLFGDLFDRTPTTLVTLEPHEPGRIPVVFIHGTASSAARWADMLNDLLDDPRIADHYEFWFFSYATGNPIPFSALLLREALEDAVHRLGGDAADPALRRMVLIGHSQGGLLAKMLAIDPGPRLWDALSRRPLDELTLTPATRDLLRRMLFVRPLPEVRRVIFIATPHRGSYVAAFSISQMVGRLVTLPLRVAKAGAEILTGNRDALTYAPSARAFRQHLRDDPREPVYAGAGTDPDRAGHHGELDHRGAGERPGRRGNDGVVQYSSAHLAGVESELVVRSGHSTQSNPQTIEEVRRILLAHLAAVPTSSVGQSTALVSR